jgi:hypothetical protein
MENKLEIPLGENKIVAEIYDMDCPEFPSEITIHLRDKNDIVIQDICLVRPHYVMSKEAAEVMIDNNIVQCIVWRDVQNEDYTDKFVIDVYEEEEQ